jgi:AcrR family transcriptional regulator
MPDVKRPTKRAQRAQETRRRIVSAARDLFVEQGYGGTLMPQIAERAGVAVQTIYFTFGTKRALLKEAVDVDIAGDFEPVVTMDRPWFQQALGAETAESMLRSHVHGTCQVLQRVAPIIQVLEAAAAADPEVAALWDFDGDPRHEVQSAAAAALLDKPGALGDITAEHAADVLYGVLSPDVYRLMVKNRGWSLAAFERWTFEVLASQLLA